MGKKINILDGDILVVAGDLDDGVEVHDLSDKGLSCHLPNTLMDANEGFSMVSKEGYPIMCGGLSTECEKYIPEMNSWTVLSNQLSSTHQFGAAALINNNEDYWITGLKLLKYHKNYTKPIQHIPLQEGVNIMGLLTLQNTSTLKLRHSEKAQTSLSTFPPTALLQLTRAVWL